jgi:head-tail adaptor
MKRGTRGGLWHVVTFENPGTPTPDPDGGYTEEWTPITPPDGWRVSIRPATVRDLERTTAGTVTAQATHIVQGDYHPGVTTKTRMKKFDGTTFQIAGVTSVDDRDREMELFCVEQLDAE